MITVSPNSKPNSFLHEFTTDPNKYLLLKRNNGVFEFVAEIDSAIGTHYPFGFDSENPNYAGCTVDWSIVDSVHGKGVYQVAVNYGVDKSLRSYCFHLQDETDGYFTIALETNGEHRNVLYNRSQTISFKRFYDTNSWQDGNTYYGKLFRDSKEVDKRVITGANYEQKNVFSQVDQFYTLRIYQTDLELYLRLLHYGLRGDNIVITDYNEDRTFDFVDIDLVGGSESSFEKFVNNDKIYQVDIKVKAKRKAIYG